MTQISCYFSSCLLQYHRLKVEGRHKELRKIKLFRPPTDPELFEKWKKAIPFCEKEFTSIDLLCDLHFVPDDYVRRENSYGRGQFKKTSKLKEGAIPSVFQVTSTSNLPSAVLRKIPVNAIASANQGSKHKSKESCHKILENANSYVSCKSLESNSLENPSASDSLLVSADASSVTNFTSRITNLDKRFSQLKNIDSRIDCYTSNSDKYFSTLVFDEISPSFNTFEKPFNHSLPLKISQIENIDSICNARSTYSKKKSHHISKTVRDSIRVVDFPPSLFGKKDSNSNFCPGFFSNLSTNKSRKRPLCDTANNVKSKGNSESLNMSQQNFCFVPSSKHDDFEKVFIFHDVEDSVASKSTGYLNSKCDVGIIRKPNFLKECLFKLVCVDSQNEPLLSDKELPSESEDDLSNNFQLICAHVRKTKLLPSWSFTFIVSKKLAIIMKWNDEYTYIEKEIIISSNFEIKVFLHKKFLNIEGYSSINGFEGLSTLVMKVDGMPLCEGYNNGTMRSDKCSGSVSGAYRSSIKRTCSYCTYEKRRYEYQMKQIEDLKKELKECDLRCKELAKENSMLCKHLESCCGIQFQDLGTEITELGISDVEM